MGDGEVHEFVPDETVYYNTKDSEVIAEFCEQCDLDKNHPVHDMSKKQHEFKLVFGGYRCSVCDRPIEDAVHQGVDLEGITDRPIRETVNTVPADQFWVDEELKPKRRLFNKMGYPAIDPTTDQPTEYFDGTTVDKLVEDSKYKRVVELKDEEKIGIPVHSSVVTPWAIVGFCALGLGIVGNSAISLYSILM